MCLIRLSWVFSQLMCFFFELRIFMNSWWLIQLLIELEQVIVLCRVIMLLCFSDRLYCRILVGFLLMCSLFSVWKFGRFLRNRMWLVSMLVCFILLIDFLYLCLVSFLMFQFFSILVCRKYWLIVVNLLQRILLRNLMILVLFFMGLFLYVENVGILMFCVWW